MKRWIGLAVTSLCLAACATRTAPSESYAVKLEAPPAAAKIASHRTVVMFLVDGLSMDVLKQELAKGRLPQIERYFLGAGRSIKRAHSVFPSLTFPNISALLHEQPVHRTGNTGNSVIVNKRVLDFESVLDRPEFGKLMTGQTIFTRLHEKGLRTVSLDYGLGVDALVSSRPLDLKSGVALELQDYQYLDRKKIESLQILLSDNKPEQWPDFIFIHLVGLDFLSHLRGPRSATALDYLHGLDRDLGPLFETLRKGESGPHTVISMLTADHGFPLQIKNHLAIESLARRINPQFSVLNEVRFAALYAAKAPTDVELSRWTRAFLKDQGVHIVASRKGNQVRISTTGRALKFDYLSVMDCPSYGFAISVDGAAPVCPDRLDQTMRQLFAPHFIENLSAYFQAEKYPDLLVIPDRSTVFKKSAIAGYHGGPTEDETIVPLLMRNATLQSADEIPALWELLRFL